MANVIDIATHRAPFIRPKLPPRLAQPLEQPPPGNAPRRTPALAWLLIMAAVFGVVAAAPADVLATGAVVLVPGVLLAVFRPGFFDVVVGKAATAVKSTRRGRRIVADRRPILLKPVIVLPPSRRAPRLLGSAPVFDASTPHLQRSIGGFNREARIVRQTAPRRPARIGGPSSRATVGDNNNGSGNDNLPPHAR